MSQPLVCAVMLVNGRPEMVRRAAESFRAQSYDPTRIILLTLDTTPAGAAVVIPPSDAESEVQMSIGALRNRACDHALPADVIAHWDSDDWSHPNRLAEQVALLESSGADAVGYDEMLFWREREQQAWLYSQHLPGVHAVAVGTSLLYWRRTWQQKPFRDTSSGEDLHFCSGLKVATASSLHDDGEPRMIASIHGGNTASVIDPKAREWTRAPEFDEYCARKMSYAREDSNTPIPA